MEKAIERFKKYYSKSNVYSRDWMLEFVKNRDLDCSRGFHQNYKENPKKHFWICKWCRKATNGNPK